MTVEGEATPTAQSPPARIRGGRRFLRPVDRAAGLIVALRPKQWAKNFLVFLAPVGAGTAFNELPMIHALVALACFCAASSAVYLMNDLFDVAEDRLHPRKRYRPIASGTVNRQAAIAAAAVLAITSVVAGLFLSIEFVVVVAGYLVLQVLYAAKLKRVVVIEMAVVASGFVIRVVAGAIAVDLTPSIWLLMVTASGALAIVTGKRLSEILTCGPSDSRSVLREYSPDFLRAVLTMASTVLVTSYTLWAFVSMIQVRPILIQLSIVPLVIGLMLYMLDSFRARTEKPEDLLSDRWLIGLGVVWFILILFGSNF